MSHALDPTVMSGCHTPGCDCGHDGMGRSWHLDGCSWRSAPAPVGVPHGFMSDDGGMFCDADLPGYGRCGFIRSAGWHTGAAVSDAPRYPERLRCCGRTVTEPHPAVCKGQARAIAATVLLLVAIVLALVFA